MNNIEIARGAFEKIKHQIEPGATVPLVGYQYDDHFFAVDGEGRPEDHVARLHELIRLITKAGSHPVVVNIHPGQYFDWLEMTGSENTRGKRAEYAAWIVAKNPENFISISGQEYL